jgi:hypothetical protein
MTAISAVSATESHEAANTFPALAFTDTEGLMRDPNFIRERSPYRTAS